VIFQKQKKILKLLNKKERFSLAVLVCLIFIGTLLETIGISAVVPVIISVSDPKFLTNNHFASEILQAFNLNDQRDIVLFMVLLLAFINFIKFIYLSFLAWMQMKFSFSLQARISEDLFRSYLSRPYEFHINKNSSLLVRNCINEVSLLTTSAVIPSIFIFTETLVLLCISSLLIVMEPVGSFSVILFMAFAASAFYLITKNRVSLWGISRQKFDGQRIQKLQEGFGGIKEVILLNLKNFFKFRNIKPSPPKTMMQEDFDGE